MNSTKQLTDSSILMDFCSSSWRWKTKNPPKPFNISGESSMFIIRGRSTLSLSTCSSVLLFRSSRLSKSVDSMLKTSRTKSLIWLSLNFRWRFLLTIWSSVDRAISSYQCLSMLRPSLTTTKDKADKPFKAMMTSDKIIDILCFYRF